MWRFPYDVTNSIKTETAHNDDITRLPLTDKLNKDLKCHRRRRDFTWMTNLITTYVTQWWLDDQWLDSEWLDNAWWRDWLDLTGELIWLNRGLDWGLDLTGDLNGVLTGDLTWMRTWLGTWLDQANDKWVPIPALGVWDPTDSVPPNYIEPPTPPLCLKLEFGWEGWEVPSLGCSHVLSLW